jgi:hypothetical protein
VDIKSKAQVEKEREAARKAEEAKAETARLNEGKKITAYLTKNVII